MRTRHVRMIKNPVTGLYFKGMNGVRDIEWSKTPHGPGFKYTMSVGHTHAIEYVVKTFKRSFGIDLLVESYDIVWQKTS